MTLNMIGVCFEKERERHEAPRMKGMTPGKESRTAENQKASTGLKQQVAEL